MKRFVKGKSFLLVSVLSAMFVLGMWMKIEYYDWYAGAMPRIAKDIISAIELPAFVISAIIGGNPDYPIFIIYFPLLFLTAVIIISGLIGLFRFVSTHAHRKK